MAEVTIPAMDLTGLVRKFPAATRVLARLKAGRLILWRVQRRLSSGADPQREGLALRLLWTLHQQFCKEIRELE